MKEAEDLLLQACAMLYEEDKHKNRARMGHILGYFRQFAPSRILEAQAIINPARFGKYAKNPESLPGKAMKDAMQALQNESAKAGNELKEQVEKAQAVGTLTAEQAAKALEIAAQKIQQANDAPAKKTRVRKAKDQCCG